MQHRFTGSFTQQEPLPEAAIAAATEVLRHGRLHRYNRAGDERGETALLEQEFAALTGARYCLAVASGGYAIATSLRAIGVQAGETVLTNGFTLAPVPGAIASIGARPVFVEITRDLTIDLDDLRGRLPGARALVLSHMRGHICDMDALMALCDAAGVPVIEDCAHTMGADWGGLPSGRHGRMACYSTQTYKHVNSGEGGLIVSDDAGAMAASVLLSGSYMLYGAHLAAPPADAFAELRLDTPNISGRMDNLRAAILRPQLGLLAARRRAWRARYGIVEKALRETGLAELPVRPPKEGFVGSSIQFLLPGWAGDEIADFTARCAARGVVLAWFGAPEPAGYTSAYRHWAYAAPTVLPATDAILAELLDMRLPLSFSLEDCALIGRILAEELALGQAGRQTRIGE